MPSLRFFRPRLAIAPLFAAAFALTAAWLSLTAAPAAAAAAGSSANLPPTILRVAYIPILPMAQLFVLDEARWAKQAGLDLHLTRFSSGPAMVQGLASGTFDVAYIGIGPAMVARAHGVDLVVLAANVLGQGGLLGRGPFAASFAAAPDAAAAFATFHHATRNPVRIATLPRGSVPDTILRYYLFAVAHVAPADVTILGMGAEQMQQALLAGSVDGASVLDPIPAIVESRDKTARLLVPGQGMLPDAPGAVIAVSAKTLAAHGDAIRRLVALHIRATRMIVTDPAAAAHLVTAAIGKNLVPEAVIAASLKASAATFVADPHRIIAPTRKLQAYQETIGSLAKPVDITKLIDTSVYDSLTKPDR